VRKEEEGGRKEEEGGRERDMLLDIQQRLTCVPICSAQETSALNFVLVG